MTLPRLRALVAATLGAVLSAGELHAQESARDRAGWWIESFGATGPGESGAADRGPAGMGLPFALLPIDHVSAGPGWRTVRVERGPLLGSDHYPVIVTLAPLP